MNILFLSSWYPTDDTPYAGLFIKEHACAIHMSGNNIKVVALIIKPCNKTLSSDTKEFIDDNGIATTIINLNTKYFNLLHYCYPLQLLYLNRFVNKLTKNTTYKFDIVHSNVIYPTGILGYWIARKLKIPHIISEHWSRINRIMRMPFFSYLCKTTYINSQKILPVSDFLKQNIQNHIPSISTSKFEIVGNIISPQHFKFLEKKHKKSDSIHFCAIATWTRKKTPDKLPELFIEALSTINKELKNNISLTMIGGGDRVDELKSLCQEKKINANFTGHIEKPKIASILQDADFFVHASTIETFSVVTAEALSCGTPVICSNVGALPELINESNGVLCENSIESWVEGLKSALSTAYNHKTIAESIKNKFNYYSIGEKINLVYSQFK